MSGIKQCINPNWEEFDNQQKHIHDWRSYIPIHIRNNWIRLTMRERLLVIEVAQHAADQEEWD